MFRARSLRALYVDWKAGGQANFMQGFAYEWWSRWQKSGAQSFTSVDWERYRTLGIDYVVLASAHRQPDRTPVFQNARWVVYRVAGPATERAGHASGVS